jgi:hypothetical protein
MGSTPTKTHIPNRNGTKKGSAVWWKIIPVFDGPYKEAVFPLIAS